MRKIISASVIYMVAWEIIFDLGFEKLFYQKEKSKRENPGSKDYVWCYIWAKKNKAQTPPKKLLAVLYDRIVEETVGIVGGIISMVKRVRSRKFFPGLLKNLKIIVEILRAVDIPLLQRKSIK